MRALAALSILSACSFSTPAADPGGPGDDGTGPDAGSATTEPDAPPGDEPVNLPLFAASNQLLFELDVDTHTSMRIGPIAEPGEDAIGLDGLALYGHTLIGISDGGDYLVSIDRTTAAITSSLALSPPNAWSGLTVIPAEDAGGTPLVLAGTPNDGKLYKIDPTTGTVTAIGSFGHDMRFFTDLAWVHGFGLVATLQDGPCDDVCFATIDPATGAATPFRTNLTENLFGMSGYRDKLWAFNHAGPVLTVDETDGRMDIAFDPQIPWTEAAQ